MHQQFYYQLRPGKDGVAQGMIHPVIAVDHGKAQRYPLDKTVKASNHEELNAWVVKSLAGHPSLEPTTRAYLKMAHTQPAGQVADTAEWTLYAEAYLRQYRHRALVGDRPEQLDGWRTWLQSQPFDAQALPPTVREYFAQCTTGGEALALMQEGPGIEWNTALMVCLNPTCKVDPGGRGHDSIAMQPRVMANKGHYGWTLSYSVTHLDYPPAAKAGAVLDIGQDVQEATATKMSSMAQRDEHGAWKDRPVTSQESAGEWLDGLLMTLRHNKDIKRNVLEDIVAVAGAAGIPLTQIIEKELPKTAFQGSGVSKALLEVVTGQPWERVEQQVTILKGLGYTDELPLYLWLYFKKGPAETYDLPSLS